MSQGQISTNESKSAETLRVESCLARFQNDPDSAFGELAGLVYERLRRLTAHILNQHFPDLHGQTDDAYHEGLLKLRTALRSEGVTPKTKQELYGLAARQIRFALQNLVQRYRRGQAASLIAGEDSQGQDVLVDIGHTTLDPAQLAAWTEFHEAVQTLEPELRQVVDMLYYDGISQEEAAAALGVPLTTLQWRWRNAKIQLALAGADLLPA